MNVANVNQNRSEETRRALLGAGRRLVVESGGRELPSIVEICERAGYSRGAFYGHFTHRDHYVDELLEEILDDLADALVRATLDGPAGVGEAVRDFVSTIGSEESDEARDLRTAYLSVLGSLRDRSPIRERHAEAMRGVIDRLETAVADGQASGRLHPDIAARDVATLLTLMGIAGVLWVDAGVPVDAKSLGETLLHLIEAPERRRDAG